MNYFVADLSAEEALVRRCRKQDPVAFGEIVDLYQQRIFGYVRRMVPTDEDAQDVVQDVFVRAYQSFPQFDSRCSVKSWLFRIATNLCIDRARAKGRHPKANSVLVSVEDESVEIPDFQIGPEQALLDSEFIEMINESLATMSEKLRAVLLLHDQQDLGYEEISSSLNIPVGTVKSRLFLARAHLHRSIALYHGSGLEKDIK